MSRSPKKPASLERARQKAAADALRSLRAALRREAAAPEEQLLVQLTQFDSEAFAWIPVLGLLPPWRAEARYVLREGRPVIRDLMIYVDVIDTDGEIPANGLTSSDLRRVRTGPDAQRGRELAELLMKQSGVPSPPVIRSRGLPRKPRYTDDEVARVAYDYWRAGPKNPRRILREKYSKDRHVTDGEIAEWIRRATDRGYLTRAKGPGDRTPRQPTQKLLDWAEEHGPRRTGGKK